MQDDNERVKVVEMDLSQIKPYWRNPRRGNVEAVKKSISDYGYNQFIVVDPENTIIVGHSRYKALLELGYAKARVIVADIDKAKAKAYRIVDNQVSDLSSWDDEMLGTELKEIGNIEDMKTYFSEEELGRLVDNTIGAKNFNPVEPEDIAKSSSDLNGQIQNFDQKRQLRHRIIICPHCGKEFEVED